MQNHSLTNVAVGNIVRWLHIKLAECPLLTRQFLQNFVEGPRPQFNSSVLLRLMQHYPPQKT